MPVSFVNGASAGSSGTIITTGSSGQVIPKAALPTGSVLQVVQATYNVSTTNNSVTYADTGLSASITPTSATSKILVFGTVPMRRQSGSVFGAGLRIVRGSTTLAIAMSGIFWSNTGSTDLSTLVPFNYLDSPATTSSTNYKIQFNAQGGGPLVYAQIDNDQSIITLMEIAA